MPEFGSDCLRHDRERRLTYMSESSWRVCEAWGEHAGEFGEALVQAEYDLIRVAGEWGCCRFAILFAGLQAILEAVAKI